CRPERSEGSRPGTEIPRFARDDMIPRDDKPLPSQEPRPHPSGMRHTTLVRIGALVVLGAAPLSAQATYDVLIRGGTAVLGNGQAPRRADIGIRGDRIAFVGTAPASATAKRVIDARGLTVTPGFIDPHTHTGGDLSSARSRNGVPDRANLPYLMQGVTTVITNN